MQLRDLSLPLLAALWALCTIVFNGTKELNFIRDRIMFADAEGFRATLPNRKLLAWNDWLPLLMLMIFACIAFGAVSGFSPMLLAAADRLPYAWALAIFVALCACGMAITLIVTGIGEWRLMCKCLRAKNSRPKDQAKTPEAEPT